MKRFFSKKSVAIILAAFVLIGAMSFGFVSTATATSPATVIMPKVGVKIQPKNAWSWSSATVPAEAVVKYQEKDPTTNTSGFFNIEVSVKYPGDNTFTKTSYIYIGSLGTKYTDSWSRQDGNNVTYFSTDQMRAMFPELWAQEGFSTKIARTVGSADVQKNNYKLKAENEANSGIVSKTIFGILDVIAGIAASPIFVAWSVTLNAINVIVAVFTALAGLIFDSSVTFSIINIRDLFADSGPVNTLWVLVRDVVNVTFIFILLYTAISKILSGWGVKEKTTIVKIIMASIVVNFSMVITKVLIDAGNYIAVALFDGIRNYSMVTNLSALILRGTNITSFITTLGSIKGQTNVIVSLLFQIVAMGVLAWTYFYTSILLIGRAVMLLFMTIISPLAFVGDIMPIPQIKSMGDWWWKTLTEQIFLAPVLMFFLYFTAIVINTSNKITEAGAATSNGNTINVSGFFTYILIIVLLTQALKITKQMSGEVGKMTVAVGKGLLAAGAIAATGGAAGAGMLFNGVKEGFTAGLAKDKDGKRAGLGAGLSTGFKRVGSGLKDYGKKAGDLVSGKAGDQPGVAGFAFRQMQGGAFTGLKAVGFDAKQKIADLKKSKKEEEDRIQKAADQVGPAAAIAKKEALEAKSGMITSAATSKLMTSKEEGDVKIRDEYSRADNNKKELDKAKITSEKNLEQARIKWTNYQEEEKRKRGKVSFEEQKKMQADTQKAKKEYEKEEANKKKLLEETEKTNDEYNKAKDAFDTKMTSLKEEIAGSMGTSLADMKKGLEDIDKEIVKKTLAKAEYITKFSQGGVLRNFFESVVPKEFRADSETVATKMWQQKGAFRAETDEETMIKMMDAYLKKTGAIKKPEGEGVGK